MAVLSREAFFESVNSIVGTDTSDDKLKFLEDMQDTYNSLVDATQSSEAEEWKSKYQAMKEKYRHRFLGDTRGIPDLDDAIDKAQEEEEKARNITIDDLFGTPNTGGREVK